MNEQEHNERRMHEKEMSGFREEDRGRIHIKKKGGKGRNRGSKLLANLKSRDLTEDLTRTCCR